MLRYLWVVHLKDLIPKLLGTIGVILAMLSPYIFELLFELWE